MAEDPKNPDIDQDQQAPEEIREKTLEEIDEELTREATERIKEQIGETLQGEYFNEEYFDKIKDFAEENGEEAAFKQLENDIKNIPQDKQLAAFKELVVGIGEDDIICTLYPYFNIGDEEAAKKILIENGNLESVQKIFPDETDMLQLFKKTIAEGKASDLIKYLNHPDFKKVDINKFAMALTKEGHIGYLSYRFKELGPFRQEVLEEILKTDPDEIRAYLLEEGCFEITDKKRLAQALIKAGWTVILVQTLDTVFDNFKIDKEILLLIIETDEEVDDYRVLKNMLMNRSDKFEGFDREVLEILLDKNRPDVLRPWAIKKVKDFDKTLVLRLMNAGQEGLKLFNDTIAHFEGILDEDIFIKWIKRAEKLEVSHIYSTKNDLFRLFNLHSKKVAKVIIEAKLEKFFSDNAEKFDDLDEEIAQLLLKTFTKKGQVCNPLINNLGHFHGLSKKTFLALTEDRPSHRIVVKNLRCFEGLDAECAEKLWLEELVPNLDKFEGVDQEELARKCLENRETALLIRNFEKFTDLPKDETYIDMALDYIPDGAQDNSALEAIASNLQKFPEINDVEYYVGILLNSVSQEVADALFKNIANIDIDTQETVDKVFEIGYAPLVPVVFNNIKYLDIDNENFYEEQSQVARNERFILANLYKFKINDKNKRFMEGFTRFVLKDTINKMAGDYTGTDLIKILDTIDHYKEIDHKEILDLLIANNCTNALNAKLEKLNVTLDDVLAQRLINEIEPEHAGPEIIGNHLSLFSKLSHATTIEFIRRGKSRYFEGNMEKFTIDDHREFGVAMIEAGHGWQLLEGELVFYVKWPESEYGKEFYKKHFKFFRDLLQADQIPMLTKEDIEFLEKEGEKRKLNQFNITIINKIAGFGDLKNFSLKTEESAKKAFEILTKKAGTDEMKINEKNLNNDWLDESLSENFKNGAEKFGYKNMFEFLTNAPNMHDAFYAFERTLKVFEASGLSENDFYNNILRQVAFDKGDYDGATSYHKLNDVTGNFETDFEKIFDIAKMFPNFEQLQILVQEIKDPKNIFASWKNLLNYKNVCDLLDEHEILEELVKEPSEKLKQYISTLLFHPTIGNKAAVRMFWQNPYQFFGLEASYTPANIHNSKKPQNYIDIYNLDLDAEEMRDALVEGKLDKIMVWNPLEVEYMIPDNPETYDLFHEILSGDIKNVLQKAFGKEGLPKKQKKETAAKVLAMLPKGKKIFDVIKGKIELDEATILEIKKQIFTEGYGQNLERYLVKINLKSDPNGVVAGDDTKCCMPFGDGKNTLYTYNPICALLTVQKEQGSGKFRTVAQSVLTKDKDIGTNIADLREKLENGKIDTLNEVIDESVLRQSPSYVACDSIEVASNYRKEQYKKLLTDLYKSFLRQYVQRFAEDQKLQSDKALTGSCTYELQHDALEKNTFLPRSPVSYSDKTNPEVHVLDLEKEVPPYWIQSAHIVNRPQIKEAEITTPNVEYLTFEDTLPTAYLEGKAYSDAANLKEGLFNMENSLIAKDINNAAKDRPNMSLKYVDDEGKMGGYMLAYEGKMGGEGENVIYVQDFARDPEAKEAGKALIKEFIKLYKENYIDKGKFVPITAEAREVSSFKVIVRGLETFGKTAGVKFELEQDEPIEKGGQKMIPVRIVPRKIT